MPTVQFIGKVLPPATAFNVSMTGMPLVTWSAPDIGLEMSFTFAVENSSVLVKCETNRFIDTDLDYIYVRALDLVRAAVDLACFATGVGATVILDTFVKPDGTSLQIVANDKRLVGLCTAYRMGEAPGKDFQTVLGVVLSEPSLFMALNDLITAISLPHHSSVTCARAIERLRHLIAPGAERKNSWELLRDNLRIDKQYLEYITSHSTGPRHGDPEHIPGNITTEITMRAWKIMNRFLEFRKRGNIALPLSDFPMLT